MRYFKSDWKLQPTSIEQQEEAPDVIREVTTYEGRREIREADGPPLTERLRVRQVRYLNLVPRG